MKKLIICFFLIHSFNSGINAQLKCPIEAFGIKYDRNSPFGDKICGALKDLDNVADGLGKNFNGVVNKVNDNMDQVVANFTRNVIGEDAVKSFENAKKKLKNISDKINKLVRDKECGAPAVYKGMVKLFDNTGKTIKELETIGKGAFNALKELKPVAGRMVEINAELSKLAALVAGKSPLIDKKLTKLISLAGSLQNDLEKIGNLDFTGFTSSVTGLVTGVGPFLLDCATCAGTISTSLVGMTAGGAGGTGGVVTSETGVGAALIPVGGITAGVSAAFGAILSQPACKGMLEKSAQIDDYVKEVTSFIKAAGQLAEDISSNTKKVIETSKALAELVQAIGEESKPSVRKIQVKLGQIGNDIKRSVASFNRNVRPGIEKLSANTLEELTKNTRQLYKCYEEFSSVGSMISQDIIDAAGNLVSASAQIIGAEKLYKEMMKGIEETKKSVVKNVQADWKKMDKQKDKFMKKLLGNKPNDPGSVAQNLFKLATNFNSIKGLLKDLDKLADKAGNFARSSVEAAVKALPSENEIKRAMAKAQVKYKEALAKIAEAENKLTARTRTAGL